VRRDHRPESHLIPIVLQTALGRRDAVTVFGTDYATRDGTCVRDYVHVSDLADAHVLALDAMARGFSGSLNLGSETGFTVREVSRPRNG
jgi:UDP-glucose 4-epimerase